MKKSNKTFLIIGGVILVVLAFVFAFLFFYNEEQLEEKLILECSKSTEVNGFSVTLSKQMYKIDDEIKYVEGMYSKIKSEYLNGETLIDYYEYQEASLRDKINRSFGSDYKYVEVIAEINGESANFDIEYTINNESKENITRILDTNIFDISIDEVSKQLEEEGFSCKSY